MSNLDARLRESVRYELKEILQRLHVTAIFVTHDIQEAAAPDLEWPSTPKGL